jgi:hypothetical protein
MIETILAASAVNRDFNGVLIDFADCRLRIVQQSAI